MRKLYFIRLLERIDVRPEFNITSYRAHQVAADETILEVGSSKTKAKAMYRSVVRGYMYTDGYIYMSGEETKWHLVPHLGVASTGEFVPVRHDIQYDQYQYLTCASLVKGASIAGVEHYIGIPSTRLTHAARRRAVELVSRVASDVTAYNLDAFASSNGLLFNMNGAVVFPVDVASMVVRVSMSPTYRSEA